MIMGAARELEVERKIISAFAGVANALGYSELHGRIIAALLIEDKPVALQEIARKTSYSLSTISLSIDFLEVLGVIGKVKKERDRQVYVQLKASLFECLKKAVLVKLEQSIKASLADFESEKKKLSKKDKKLLRTINVLEKEIIKLNAFLKSINSFSK